MAARRGENVLVMLVIPLAVLLFFAAVPVVPAGERPVDALLPGTLALGVVAAAFVNLGIATAYERGYGVLKRLGGAPIRRSDVVVAKILAVLVIEIVQAVLLIGVAWVVLGWRPGPGAVPLLLPVAIGLGTAAFGGLGLAIAGRLRPEATLAVANGVFVALALLGGVIVPVERLPPMVASVASILPTAPLAQLFAVGLGSAGQSMPAGAVLVVWAVAGVALAVRWFRWD